VPIGLLTPIMKDLLSYGRVNRPARPWLGMLATESDDSVVVGSVTDNGPADQAECVFMRYSRRFAAYACRNGEVKALAACFCAKSGLTKR